MTAISRHFMDRLPATARDKLHVLDQQSSETRALSSNSYAELLDIQNRVRDIEARRSRLSENVALGGSKTSEEQRHGALKECDEELAALADQRARLGARSELSKASSQRLAELLRTIAEWLNALPTDLTLAEHHGSDRSSKSEVSPTMIEHRRRRVRELIADVRRIDAVPYPAAVAKQAAREEIEQLAERGRPAVYRTIELLEPIEWPEQVIDIPTTLAIPKARDGIALLAWLRRDELIAAVEKEIDANADDEHALTDAQRSEAFKTALGDLLAAEREEEALIQAAHFNADRRPDADPRAVLGLSSDLPGPKRVLVHSRLILSVETLAVRPKPRQEGPGKMAAAINVHRTTPKGDTA